MNEKNFYIMYLKSQFTFFTQSNYFHSGEVRLHDKSQFIVSHTPFRWFITHNEMKLSALHYLFVGELAFVQRLSSPCS